MRYVTTDLSAFEKLRLSDGRKATDLRLNELRRALEQQQIPNLQSDMGKSALLAVYAGHLAAIAAQAPGVSKGRKVSTVCGTPPAIVSPEIGGG